jgi:hypothetical protein
MISRRHRHGVGSPATRAGEASLQHDISRSGGVAQPRCCDSPRSTDLPPSRLRFQSRSPLLTATQCIATNQEQYSAICRFLSASDKSWRGERSAVIYPSPESSGPPLIGT